MRNHIVKLASILAADFARLGEQIAEAERAGADGIHVDVMDGHLVPNMAIGTPIVQSIRRVTRIAMETHFMICDADSFLDEYVEADSTSFLVHCEGNNNLHRTVQRIKALGKRAGAAINPATPGSSGRNIARLGLSAGYDRQSGTWASALSAIHGAKDSAGRANDRANQSELRAGS